MRRAALLALLLAAAGCSKKLYVKSDTSWSGSLGSAGAASVDGQGDAIFDAGGGVFCWSFQKRTSGGYLEAYVRGGLLSGDEGRARTTAQYGVVSGCAGGR